MDVQVRKLKADLAEALQSQKRIRKLLGSSEQTISLNLKNRFWMGRLWAALLDVSLLRMWELFE